MSSPTMGAWECIHGVDGRDFCADCCSLQDGWRWQVGSRCDIEGHDFMSGGDDGICADCKFDVRNADNVWKEKKMNKWKKVGHEPVWAPAQLRFNEAGDTKPGFECAHQLENGNGACKGNVFELEQAIGQHFCVVVDE